MPRPPRIHVPGGYYHVILRGNHRQPIFGTAGDRDRWETIFADALNDCDGALHAYCWMTNHVHMVVQPGPVPVGRIIHRSASNYARWLQRRVPTTGHLFERRHGAILITTDAYLLALVRYIHQNPVRAGIATEVADYPWTSHLQYLGRNDRPWLTTSRVLELLDHDRARARQRYREFMSEVAPNRPEQNEPESPTSAVSSDVPRGPRRDTPDGRDSLVDLAEKIASQHGLRLQDLRSGSRVRTFTQVRTIVAWRAVAAGIATLSEVAELFGRSTSAMSQSLVSMRKTHPHLLVSPDGDQ